MNSFTDVQIMSQFPGSNHKEELGPGAQLGTIGARHGEPVAADGFSDELEFESWLQASTNWNCQQVG
jgi:hypothetical protein